MFSSSFVAEQEGGFGRMARLIEASFGIIEREQPKRYQELYAGLAGLLVAIATPNEYFGVSFDAIGAKLVADPRGASLNLELAPNLIADLLRGRLTLHEALISDRLIARGDLENLVRFHDGLMRYLHAATRAPGFPDLWGRFQREFSEELATK